ncbi:MAG TPA: helix-hairpin-helix domain-containing protein [Tepidisphaeraceae bacterium]|nr:helix-hairpin-helix domain-containing protein [Tepidisphaeraceae bacterium]
MTLHTLHTARHRRRGTVLIVSMLICFALAATVLTLGRSVRVELATSSNLAASIQAAAVERGAEQYVLAVLADNQTDGSLPDLEESFYNQVPVGDGYFWVLRPDYGDTAMPLFGLVDESGKVNINSADYDSLMKLPNMSTELANAIVAYRGATGTTTNPGSVATEPQQLGGGFYAKNSAFETVEEILMVQGATRELVYGNGSAGPLGQASGGLTGGSGSSRGLMTDLATARGLYDYLTIYSPTATTPPAAAGGGGGGAAAPATTGPINVNVVNQRDRLREYLRTQLGNARGDEVMNQIRPNDRFANLLVFYYQLNLKPDEFDKIAGGITVPPTTPRALINVNTAPREVLLTIPGLESGDVDKLLAARPATPGNSSGSFGTASSSASSDTTGPSISWVVAALDRNKAVRVGDYISASTTRVSADILAVSANGRAFKRVRIVVDVSGDAPQVIYRREITDRGWPLDPALLEQIRDGQALVTTGAGLRGGATGGTFR